MIDHSTIERIFDAAQITEVVQEFVSLKKRGVNYLGLCPFHNEKTPSFTVSPAKGIFKCFGCGKGGNAVNFVMEHEHLSYPEALRWLAKKYNIEIEEKEASAEEIQKQNERESLLVVTQYAAKHFTESLFRGREGMALGLSYFHERGFRDEVLHKFDVGYCNEKRDDFTRHAMEAGYKKEFLVASGLTIDKEDYVFDRFAGRIMFPIHSLSGQVLGFGGRIIKTDPRAAKYVNTPETEIYHKSRIVYGIFQARQAISKEDRCYLVEGYTDVLSMHEAGVENVVASSGTALTQEQIRLIKRFTPNITMLYDGDQAGVKASVRGTDMVLEEGMNVRIVLLPPTEDPDSYSKKVSNEEFRKYLADNETDFIRFKTKLLLDEAKSDPVRRANLVREVVRSIAVIPDQINRTIYVKECSMLLSMPEEVVLDEVMKLRKQQSFRDRNAYPVQDAIVSAQAAPQRQKKKEETSFYSERELLRMLLRYGTEVLTRETDRETGIETVTTVADFIIAQVTEDELEFEDPLFDMIFKEITFNVSQGLFPGDRHFVHHPDPAISAMAVDMLTEQYALSKIWSTRGSYVETEQMKLKEVVPDVVLKFKGDKIKMMQKELRRAMTEAAGDDEKIVSLQERYKVMTSLQKKISTGLGNRIIM
ncbi:MAG TPA: DNA primase [Bacteroidales bacterium]|nr:DNA primase [Bacteroidales bacterium]